MSEEVFPIWPLWVTDASPRPPTTSLHTGPEQTLCLCQRPGPMTVPSSWQEAGKQRGKVGVRLRIEVRQQAGLPEGQGSLGYGVVPQRRVLGPSGPPTSLSTSTASLSPLRRWTGH